MTQLLNFNHVKIDRGGHLGLEYECVLIDTVFVKIKNTANKM